MKLLNPQQVSDILGVSRSTAVRMIEDGSLPSITLRAGKKKKIVRVREDRLERLLLNLEAKGKDNRKSPAVSAGVSEVFS